MGRQGATHQARAGAAGSDRKTVSIGQQQQAGNFFGGIGLYDHFRHAHQL